MANCYSVIITWVATHSLGPKEYMCKSSNICPHEMSPCVGQLPMLARPHACQHNVQHESRTPSLPRLQNPKLSCLYIAYSRPIETHQWALGTSLTMHTLGHFGLCMSAHDISQVESGHNITLPTCGIPNVIITTAFIHSLHALQFVD